LTRPRFQLGGHGRGRRRARSRLGSARVRRHSARVPEVAPPGGTRGGDAALASLSHTHSQRTAWVNARCNTTCTRCTVAAANGPPPAPPPRSKCRRRRRYRRSSACPRQLAEQRREVTLDDAAVPPQRRCRPTRRGVRQPTVEEVGDRACSQPGVAGLIDELAQPFSGVPSGALHRLGGPPLLAGVGVDTEVNRRLPAARPR
jgi:hypothetical protein